MTLNGPGHPSSCHDDVSAVTYCDTSALDLKWVLFSTVGLILFYKVMIDVQLVLCYWFFFS